MSNTVSKNEFIRFFARDILLNKKATANEPDPSPFAELFIPMSSQDAERERAQIDDDSVSRDDLTGVSFFITSLNTAAANLMPVLGDSGILYEIAYGPVAERPLTLREGGQYLTSSLFFRYQNVEFDMHITLTKGSETVNFYATSENIQTGKTQVFEDYINIADFIADEYSEHDLGMVKAIESCLLTHLQQ